MIADRVARFAGVVTVLGLGFATLGIHLAHALNESETVVSIALGVFIPILLSLCLVLTAVSMYAEGMAGRFALRVAGWVVGGAAALSAMGVLTVLYQRVEQATLSHPEFVVTNLATWGATTGVLVGLYDVKHRRTRDGLVSEREKADRLGQQLAVLNRVLRHDVRNGVNVIAGFAELVRDEPDAADDHARRIERRAAALQETSENARRIERMINDEGMTEPTDLVECVERAIQRIRQDYPDATVRADLPASARVSAHPLVHFAVENVLDNAVEHNDAPEPVVEVSASRVEDGDRAFVAVRIADDGPGIPEEELAVLAEGRETQLRHASGLGLWLVDWIVTESGGEVEFEEREPRGSVVTLRLPAVEDPGSE